MPDKTLDDMLDPKFKRIMMWYMDRMNSLLDRINNPYRGTTQAMIEFMWHEIDDLQIERNRQIKALKPDPRKTLYKDCQRIAQNTLNNANERWTLWYRQNPGNYNRVFELAAHYARLEAAREYKYWVKHHPNILTKWEGHIFDWR